MTQPAPQPDGMRIAELGDLIRNSPRWVVIGIVVAGGLLAYWFFSVREEKVPDVSWHDRAVDLLVERGYYRPNAERAVTAYINGGYMTAEDVALITIVLRALGKPPKYEKAEQPSTPTTEYPGDPIDIPNDEPTYDLPSGMSPGEYWYVPVAPAGWSSTFNGIALQFYGSTSRAPFIQQENPDLQSTTYGKLPVGATVKVPRT